MKKSVFFIILLFCCCKLNAQSSATIDSALHYNISALHYDAAVSAKLNMLKVSSPDDTTEGGDVENFERNTRYNAMHIDPNVSIGQDLLGTYKIAMKTLMTTHSYCAGSAGGGWTCIGPFNSSFNSGEQNQGRINYIWVNPTDTEKIVIGSYGGVWKSDDHGLNWQNISDNIGSGYGNLAIPGTMGVATMAVNDANPNYMTALLQDWGGTGFGAVYTTNGGASWIEDTSYNNNSGYNFFNPLTGPEMMYMPHTQSLYGFFGGNVLLKDYPGDNWHKLTTPSLGISNGITAMEFSKASPGKVLFSTAALAGTAYLYIYDTLSKAWSGIPITRHNVYDTLLSIGDFDVSITDTVFMLLNYKSGSANPQGIVAVSGTGSLPETVIDTNITGFQYFKVSPYNTNHFYFSLHDGSDAFYQSINRGKTLSIIDGSSHADGRFFYLYKPDAGGNVLNDVLYGVTDGGVSKKRFGLSDFQSITGKGLCITEFFSLHSSDFNENILIAGAQDNGGNAYNKKRVEPWDHVVGGDNTIVAFLHSNVPIAYTPDWYFHNIHKITFSDTTESDTSLGSPPHVKPINDYRPFWVDQSNNIYLGENSVWKRLRNGSSWIRPFPSPLDDTAKQTVGDLAISNSDTNTVYVLYPGTAKPGVTLTGIGNTDGKLFVSINAYSGLPSWNSITPSLTTSYGLQDIEIDPNNDSRIWIGYRGIDNADLSVSASDAQRRVLYSPDRGTTLYDVSSGLPPFNIIKIKYRPGSNDELYCGTSVGIYKCDFSKFNPSTPPYYGITWNCFNDGMPICEVTDIDIDNCNKMRISTMGRGVWEHQLDNFPLKSTQTISPFTTWSGGKKHYIDGSISVPSGVTFTISQDTVYMPSDGVISVEPGGNLVIQNNALITNGCENCMWQGIQARGNPSESQDERPLIHEALVIINNSVIEHAKVGVANSNTRTDWSTNGGIIQATSSKFLNCDTGVCFNGYDNYHYHDVPLRLFPNRSFFNNDTFIIDNNYRGYNIGLPFSCMAYMRAVEGIKFSGCQFLNRFNTWPHIGEGEGIHAENSGFNVLSYCPATRFTVPLCVYPQQSRFCGFRMGINNLNSRDFTLNVRVDKAEFDSCSIGEYTTAYPNMMTTACNFKIGNGADIDSVFAVSFSGCHQNIGIMSRNAPYTWTDGNTFTGYPNGIADWYNYGIVMANGGGKSNGVYRNTFNNLSLAVYSLGNNRWTHDDTGSFTIGLQVRCNNFTQNNQAIIAVEDGSLGWQGMTSQQVGGQPAGNSFSSTGPDHDYLTNNVGLAAIQYYFDLAYPADKPTLLGSGPTTLYIYGTTGKSCPSDLYDPFGAGPYPASYAAMALHAAHFHTDLPISISLRNALTARVDMGNTPVLLSMIDTITSSSSLYSLLSGGAPYISAHAVMAAADRHLLTYTQMFNVMMQNPDDLVTDGYIDHVNTGYGFTPADADTLMAAIYHTTARTSLSDSADLMAQAADMDAFMVMTALKSSYNPAQEMYDTLGSHICTDTANIYYGVDSNSYYAGMDSIDTWERAQGGVESVYERAGYYNFIGQRGRADSLLTALGSLLPSASSDSITRSIYNSHMALWSVVKGAEDVGRDLYHLTPAEVATIGPSGDAVISINTADVVGREIIHVYGGGGGTLPYPDMHLCLAIAHLGGKQSNNSTKPIHGSGTTNDNWSFSAYPNPTSSIVTFTYDFPANAQDVKITLTSLLGEKVATIYPAGTSGNTTWDPAGVASGVYIYEASDSRGIRSKGKLVVTGK